MAKTSSADSGENYQAILANRMMAAVALAVNSSFQGKITAITPPTVSVQPEALTVDGNKKEALVEHVMVIVPTNSNGTVKLKVGDRVACGVFDHDTTHYTGKGFYRQMEKTPHQINNAYVVGKIAKKEDFDV